MRSGTQLQQRILFILPVQGAGHIIKKDISIPSHFISSPREDPAHMNTNTLNNTNMFWQKLLLHSLVHIIYIRFASSLILALKEADVSTVEACL